MSDGTFGMFRGHVSMTSLTMLNRLRQIGNRFCQMRALASSNGLLQRGFGMCHKLLSMTLFAMVYRFRCMLDGISDACSS
jgi:hypothetical protein